MTKQTSLRKIFEWIIIYCYNIAEGNVPYFPLPGPNQSLHQIWASSRTKNLHYSGPNDGMFFTTSAPESFWGAVFNFGAKIGLKSTKNVLLYILFRPMGKLEPPPPWLCYCPYARFETCFGLNPFTTNGTIRPKNIFEASIGKTAHLILTLLYPSGKATYYASYHAIKFLAIASFFESSLFSPTNSKVSFCILGLVSCS